MSWARVRLPQLYRVWKEGSFSPLRAETAHGQGDETSDPKEGRGTQGL
jgi:hypothetical protein